MVIPLQDPNKQDPKPSDSERRKQLFHKATMGWEPAEKAQLWANVMQETAGLTQMRELVNGFNEDGSPIYADFQEPYAPYTGRGGLMLTWDFNYREYAESIGEDSEMFINNPELLEEDEHAVGSALWFWENKVRPNVGEGKRVGGWEDVAGIREIINGGDNGLEDVEKFFGEYLEKFNTDKLLSKPGSSLVLPPLDPEKMSSMETYRDLLSRSDMAKNSGAIAEYKKLDTSNPWKSGDHFYRDIKDNQFRTVERVRQNPEHLLKPLMDELHKATDGNAILDTELLRQQLEKMAGRRLTPEQEDVISRIKEAGTTKGRMAAVWEKVAAASEGEVDPYKRDTDPTGEDAYMNKLVQEFSELPEYVGNKEEEHAYWENALRLKAELHLSYVELLHPERLDEVKELMSLSITGVPQQPEVISWLQSQEYLENTSSAANIFYYASQQPGLDIEELAENTHRRGDLFDPFPYASHHRMGMSAEERKALEIQEGMEQDYNEMETMGGVFDVALRGWERWVDTAEKSVQKFSDEVTGFVEPGGLVSAVPYIFHRHTRDQQMFSEVSGHMMSMILAIAPIQKLLWGGVALTGVPSLGKAASIAINGTSFATYVALSASHQTHNPADIISEMADDEGFAKMVTSVFKSRASDSDWLGTAKQVITWAPLDAVFQLTMMGAAMGWYKLRPKLRPISVLGKQIGWDGRELERAAMVRFMESDVIPALRQAQENINYARLRGGLDVPENVAIHTAEDLTRAIDELYLQYIRAAEAPRIGVPSAPAPTSKFNINYRGQRIPTVESDPFAAFGAGGIEKSWPQKMLAQPFKSLEKQILDDMDTVTSVHSFPWTPNLFRDSMDEPISSTFNYIFKHQKMPLAQILKSLSLTKQELEFTGLNAVLEANANAKGYDAINGWLDPKLKMEVKQLGYDHTDVWDEWHAPGSAVKSLKSSTQGKIDYVLQDEMGGDHFSYVGHHPQHGPQPPRPEPLKSAKEGEDIVQHSNLSMGVDPGMTVPHLRNQGAFVVRWQNPPAYDQWTTSAKHFGTGKLGEVVTNEKYEMAAGEFLLDWHPNTKEDPRPLEGTPEYDAAILEIQQKQFGLTVDDQGKLVFDNTMVHGRFGEEKNTRGKLGTVIEELQADYRTMVTSTTHHPSKDVHHPLTGKESKAGILRAAQIAAKNDSDSIRTITPSEQSKSLGNFPKTQDLYAAKGKLNNDLRWLFKKYGITEKNGGIVRTPISEQGKGEIKQWGKMIDEYTAYAQGVMDGPLHVKFMKQTYTIDLRRAAIKDVPSPGLAQVSVSIDMAQDTQSIEVSYLHLNTPSTVWVNRPLRVIVPIDRHGFDDLGNSIIVEGSLEKGIAQAVSVIRRKLQGFGFGSRTDEIIEYFFSDEMKASLTASERTPFEFHAGLPVSSEDVKALGEAMNKTLKKLQAAAQSGNVSLQEKLKKEIVEIQEGFLGTKDTAHADLMTLGEEELVEFINLEENAYIKKNDPLFEKLTGSDAEEEVFLEWIYDALPDHPGKVLGLADWISPPDVEPLFLLAVLPFKNSIMEPFIDATFASYFRGSVEERMKGIVFPPTEVGEKAKAIIENSHWPVSELEHGWPQSIQALAFGGTVEEQAMALAVETYILNWEQLGLNHHGVGLSVHGFLRPLARSLGVKNVSAWSKDDLFREIKNQYLLMRDSWSSTKETIVNKILEAKREAVYAAQKADFTTDLTEDIFVRGRTKTPIWRAVDSFNQARSLVASLDAQGSLSKADKAKLERARTMGVMRAEAILAMTEGRVNVWDFVKNYSGEGAIDRFLADLDLPSNLSDKEIFEVVKVETEVKELDLSIGEMTESLEKDGYGGVIDKVKSGEKLESDEIEALGEAVAGDASRIIERTEKELELTQEISEIELRLEESERVLKNYEEGASRDYDKIKGHEQALKDLGRQLEEVTSTVEDGGLLKRLESWKETATDLRRKLREADEVQTKLFQSLVAQQKVTGLDVGEAKEVDTLRGQLASQQRKIRDLNFEVQKLTREVTGLVQITTTPAMREAARVASSLKSVQDNLGKANERNIKLKNIIAQLKSKLKISLRDTGEKAFDFSSTHKQLLEDVLVIKQSLGKEFDALSKEIKELEEELGQLPASSLDQYRSDVAELEVMRDDLVAKIEEVEQFPLFNRLTEAEETELVTFPARKLALLEDIARLKKVFDETPIGQLKIVKSEADSLERQVEKLYKELESPRMGYDAAIKRIEELEYQIKNFSKMKEQLSKQLGETPDYAIKDLEARLARLLELKNVLDVQSGKIDPVAQAIQELQGALKLYDRKRSQIELKVTEPRAYLELAFYRLQKLRAVGMDNNASKITRSTLLPSGKDSNEVLEWSTKNSRQGRWRASKIHKFLYRENGFDRNINWATPENRVDFLAFLNDHKLFGNSALVPSVIQSNLLGLRRGLHVGLQHRLSSLVTGPGTATLALISGITELGFRSAGRGLNVPFLRHINYKSFVQKFGHHALADVSGSLNDIIPERASQWAAQVPILKNIADLQVSLTWDMRSVKDWLDYMDAMDKFGALPSVAKPPKRTLAQKIGVPTRRSVLVEEEAAAESVGVGEGRIKSAGLGGEETFEFMGGTWNIRDLGSLAQQAFSVENELGQKLALLYVGIIQSPLREGIGTLDYYLQLAGIDRTMTESVANILHRTGVTAEDGHRILVALREMENLLITGELPGSEMRDYIAGRLGVKKNDDMVDYAFDARTSYLNQMKVPSLTQSPAAWGKGYVGLSDHFVFGHLNEFARTQINTLDLNLQRGSLPGYIYNMLAHGDEMTTPMGKFYAQNNALVGSMIIGAGAMFAGMLTEKYGFEFDERGDLRFRIKQSREDMLGALYRVGKAGDGAWDIVMQQWNETYGTDYDHTTEEGIMKFLNNEVLQGDENYVYYNIVRFSNIDALLKIGLYLNWMWNDYAPGIDWAEWHNRDLSDHAFGITRMLIASYGGNAMAQTFKDLSAIGSVDMTSLEEQAVMIISDMLYHAKGFQQSVPGELLDFMPSIFTSETFLTDKDLSGGNFAQKITARSMFSSEGDRRVRRDAAGDPILRKSWLAYTMPQEQLYTTLQQLERRINTKFEPPNHTQMPSSDGRFAGINTKAYRHKETGVSIYEQIIINSREVPVGGNMLHGELKNYYTQYLPEKEEECHVIERYFSSGEHRADTEKTSVDYWNELTDKKMAIKKEFYGFRKKYLVAGADLINLDDYEEVVGWYEDYTPIGFFTDDPKTAREEVELQGPPLIQTY